MAQIMTQSFLLTKKTASSYFHRTVVGKAIGDNPIETRLGGMFRIVNACSYTGKEGYYFLCMWMTSDWLERNEI